MKKRWRKLQAPLIVTGVLLVVLIGTYLFLMSEYSLRNLWFPIVEERTGIKITAEECSISLFREHSFQGRTIKFEHEDFSLSAASADVQADLFDFLFKDILTVHSMELDNAEFVLQKPVTPESFRRNKRTTSVRVPVPPQQPMPPPGTPRPEKKKKQDLPVHIGKISGKNLKLTIHGGNGERFLFRNAEVLAENMIPSQTANVSIKGEFQASAKDFRATNSAAEAKVRFLLPKQGFLPENLVLDLNIPQTDLTFKQHKSERNQLALNLELKRNGTLTDLTSFTCFIRNAEKKDLMSLELKGSLGEKLTQGNLTGELKLQPSALGDAIVSELSRIAIQDLAGSCKFQAEFQPEGISSEVKLYLFAKSAAVAGSKETPIQEPELRADLKIRIMPEMISVDSVEAVILQQKKVTGRFKLKTPWKFIPDQLPSIPQAKVDLNRFPLLYLVLFGLHPAYASGTLDGFIGTKPGADNSSDFVIQTVVNAPAAELDHLSLDVRLRMQGEQITVEQGTILYGTKEKSVSAELTGMYMKDFSSMEFDTAMVIRNPGAFFQIRELEQFTEIKPKFQLKALFSKDGVLDLWIEGASGKYRIDLISKHRFELYDTSPLKGTLRLRAGETLLAELPFTCQLPEKLTWHGIKLSSKNFEISGKTSVIHPQLYREIAPYLPEKVIFDQAKTSLSFRGKIQDGRLSGNAEYLFQNCLIKEWTKGKTARWDGRIAIGGNCAPDVIHLQKGALETTLNGKKMAHLDLTGTIPRKKGGSYALSVTGDEFDLVLTQEFMEKTFPNFDFLKRLANLTRPGKKPAIRPAPAKPAAAPQKPVPAKPASAQKIPAGKTQKHFPAIDLSRYNGSSLKFHIRKMTYTKDLSASWKGTAVIKGKLLDLRTEELLLNGKSSLLDFSVDPSVENKYAYTMILRLSDFSFNTLCKVISGGKYHQNSGTFRFLDLFVKGTGLAPEQIKNNVQGVLRFEMERFSLNTQDFKEEELIQTALDPLRSVEPMMQMKPKLARTSVGKYLVQLSKELEQILSGRKNLEFAMVKTDLQFQQGILQIRNFELIGGVVDSEQLSGYIHLPTGIKKLDSVLTIEGISIPFRIAGPKREFKLDFSKTSKNLLKYNAKSIRDPKKIRQLMHSIRELMEAYQ